MYKWQPGKWAKFAAVGAGLPVVAAGWLNTDSMESDIKARAAAAAGDWANVQINGRDAVVTGTAPNQEAIDAAVKAVTSTYGVRLADLSGVTVGEAKAVEATPAVEAPAAPTVAVADLTAAAPIATGTWAEGKATGLEVSVNKDVYKLGTNPELTSAAGNWTLALPAALPAGDYTVTAAQVVDGQLATAVAPVSVAVAAPAVETPAVEAAAPTVAVANLAATPAIASGTWAEGKATGLEVSVNKDVYKLGTNPELTSAAGNWTLALPAALPAGDYAVKVAQVVGDKLVEAAAPLAVAVAVAAPAVEAAAPTVAVANLAATPAIASGTWAEGKATGLEVSVNDQVYALGKNPELTSAAGNWTLALPAALPAGDYAVKVAQVVGDKLVEAAAPLAVAVAAPAAPEAPPPLPMKAPKLEPVTVEAGKPVTLTGSWSSGSAKNLSVSLNGNTATLGTDANLTSDESGKWTFNAGDLAPGHYDVIVKSGDEANMLRAETSFDIAAPAVVAEPAPAVELAPAAFTAPIVHITKSDMDRPTVTGTWAIAPDRKLQVELDGITHTLGTDADLTTDLAGIWKLTPAKPVINGTYDVIAKVTAADGTSAVDATSGEVTVTVAAPPAEAPAAGLSYDCEGTLAKIAASFPVRFDTDKSDLTDRYQTSLSLYGALLSDTRCNSLKVHVEGFADERGGADYNQALSERRSKAVVDSLVAAKIDAARLTSSGSGMQKPLDPARTDDAYAKNRRVEISIKK